MFSTEQSLDANKISGTWGTGPEAESGPGSDESTLDALDDEKEYLPSSIDSEGVWSPDVEQAFQEALKIYPPCGRRKICLKNQNKMYGRNELIARYIKLKTGKARTRKQVSSHIQVLGRRKLREIQAKLRMPASAASVQMVVINPENKEKVIVPTTSLTAPHAFPAAPPPKKVATHPPPSLEPISTQSVGSSFPTTVASSTAQLSVPISFSKTNEEPEDVKPFLPLPPPFHPSRPLWNGRAISTSKFSLVEFSAYVEYCPSPDLDLLQKHLFVHIGEENPTPDPILEAVDVRQIYDKFPEKRGLREMFDKGPQDSFFLVKFWADLNYTFEDDNPAFYRVTSRYESYENMTITCSTKLCSFGKQVVEKVETEYARFENGRFVYNIHRSPMCEYMVNFIHKLKHLPAKYNKNSVLENFTILQVISNHKTEETLLCTAYVFEVSTSEYGAQHHIYRLVKD